MTILAVLKISIIAGFAVVGIASFMLGLLYKKVLMQKQKKRILRLEDEMLSNHSTILALEKKLSEFQKDKVLATDYNLSHGKRPDQGLKAS